MRWDGTVQDRTARSSASTVSVRPSALPPGPAQPGPARQHRAPPHRPRRVSTARPKDAAAEARAAQPGRRQRRMRTCFLPGLPHGHGRARILLSPPRYLRRAAPRCSSGAVLRGRRDQPVRRPPSRAALRKVLCWRSRREAAPPVEEGAAAGRCRAGPIPPTSERTEPDHLPFMGFYSHKQHEFPIWFRIAENAA